MNKSKIIAGIIYLAIILGPFQMLFITDEVVHGAKFIALFMATLIGFFVAFGIGTNEPFNRKNETLLTKEVQQNEERGREAA